MRRVKSKRVDMRVRSGIRALSWQTTMSFKIIFLECENKADLIEV